MAGGLSRRAVILGMTLGACAPLRHGDLPMPDPGSVRAPYRLRIVIFELAGPDVPFHAGLIATTPDETLLYDPAGEWHPEGQRRGGSDVIRGLTPAQESAYLARTGIRYSLGGWVVHLFDRAVAPEVALRAQRLAMERPRSLPLHCAYNVSSLLAELPGFEGITPHRVTTDFLRQLLLRDDLTYSRIEPAMTQSG